MRGSRIAAALVLIALAIPAAASSSLNTSPSASSVHKLTSPAGLKGFLLNYSEPARHVFPTQPAFAWAPSPNAQHYEFQLSRSSSFRDSAIVYQNPALPSPTAAIPVTLPWVGGHAGGYGFFARVRAVTDNGTTPWSRSYGFDVRWPNIPTPLPSPDGLLRWTPVVGASEYEVWEMGITGAGADYADRQVDLHADERRRRARLVHVPRGQRGRLELVQDDPVACSRHSRREPDPDEQRLPADVLRPVEPCLHDDERRTPGRADAARPRRDRLGRRRHLRRARRTRLHARLQLDREPRPHRRRSRSSIASTSSRTPTASTRSTSAQPSEALRTPRA